MLLDLLTSSQTQAVVGAAVASMNMMSSMGPMPMTMASGAPPGNVTEKEIQSRKFSAMISKNKRGCRK